MIWLIDIDELYDVWWWLRPLTQWLRYVLDYRSYYDSKFGFDMMSNDLTWRQWYMSIVTCIMTMGKTSWSFEFILSGWWQPVDMIIDDDMNWWKLYLSPGPMN